ncbi:hypothetical protein ACP70R_021347 [Stipagrostis hirtigluma subsp. patula]
MLSSVLHGSIVCPRRGSSSVWHAHATRLQRQQQERRPRRVRSSGPEAIAEERRPKNCPSSPSAVSLSGRELSRSRFSLVVNLSPQILAPPPPALAPFLPHPIRRPLSPPGCSFPNSAPLPRAKHRRRGAMDPIPWPQLLQDAHGGDRRPRIADHVEGPVTQRVAAPWATVAARRGIRGDARLAARLPRAGMVARRQQGRMGSDTACGNTGVRRGARPCSNAACGHPSASSWRWRGGRRAAGGGVASTAWWASRARERRIDASSCQRCSSCCCPDVPLAAVVAPRASAAEAEF